MKLIVATQNSHKVREIAAILGNRIEVLSLKDVGFHKEIVEDGDTFEKNAQIKVLQLMDFIRTDQRFKKEASIIALADDSGLEVDFLHGAPGVRSARYAGDPGNDQANFLKLLMVLKGVPGSKRTARFRCVLAAMRYTKSIIDQPNIQIFEGICEGKIGFKLKGQNGFGYDPLFFPTNFCRTFAELSDTEKNQISHRAVALGKFEKWLESILSEEP